MAKANKQASALSGTPALTKRYGSISEIKRDLFPNAAAEEADIGRGNREYEKLMDEFFGPRQHSSA
jgi:hypothetical protein